VFDQSNTLNFAEFYPEKFSDDTIKTESPKQNTAFLINNSAVLNPLSGATFGFQVNSDICYYCISHFRKNEAKKSYTEAWLKERELMRILLQTDSLRKVYAGSSDDKKEEIAVYILKNEEQSRSLRPEIQALDENARNLEDQYWKSAPMEEKVLFLEKLKAFRDSTINETLKEVSKNSTHMFFDTVHQVFESPQSKERKTKTTSETAVYKIQIGAFKGKIPDASNKMIKKLSMLRKVENYTDEKGLKVYTTGNLKTYQEAVTLQAQVKQEGVKNPLIIAFQKGKKITVDEAKKLNHEL
jgi:hypothetical protein